MVKRTPKLSVVAPTIGLREVRLNACIAAAIFEKISQILQQPVRSAEGTDYHEALAVLALSEKGMELVFEAIEMLDATS